MWDAGSEEFLRSSKARRRYWARSYAGWRRVTTYKPSPAHVSLASLENSGHVSFTITQNVDSSTLAVYSYTSMAWSWLSFTWFPLRNICYISDVSEIPEETYPLLENCELLIMDALRPHRSSATHFGLPKSGEISVLYM